jgi:hypothetical protein
MINKHYKNVRLVSFEITVNPQSLTGESEVPFTLITGCDAMLKHRHV